MRGGRGVLLLRIRAESNQVFLSYKQYLYTVYLPYLQLRVLV